LAAARDLLGCIRHPIACAALVNHAVVATVISVSMPTDYRTS
jgi:hypothetical protein